MTKYCSISDYGYNGYTDSKTVLEPEDDAAHVNWGGDWRMPTYVEFQELLDNCTCKFTFLNGAYGFYLWSNLNGNSIFLPAAGYRYNTSLCSTGAHIQCLTSSLCDIQSDAAFCFHSHEEYASRSIRAVGATVRPVHP